MSECKKDWLRVCTVSDLVMDSGVCALIHENTQNEQQIALFCLGDDQNKQIYAVGNYDPIGKANVLYRGLLGSSL